MLRFVLLVALLASAGAQMHDHDHDHDHDFTSMEMTGPCFTDPASTDCKKSHDFYNESYIEADLHSLCEMMSWMSGCTVMDKCKSGDIASTASTCTYWSQLAGICSTEYGETMSGMSGCKNYVNLCTPSGSMVENCTTDGPQHLVPSMKAQDLAVSYCAANPSSSACANNMCKSKAAPDCPDPLLTLSGICTSGLSSADKTTYCTEWDKMCSGSTSGELAIFCSSASTLLLSPLTLLLSASLALSSSKFW